MSNGTQECAEKSDRELEKFKFTFPPICLVQCTAAETLEVRLIELQLSLAANQSRYCIPTSLHWLLTLGLSCERLETCCQWKGKLKYIWGSKISQLADKVTFHCFSFFILQFDGSEATLHPIFSHFKLFFFLFVQTDFNSPINQSADVLSKLLFF